VALGLEAEEASTVWADAERVHQPSDWMAPIVNAKASKKYHHIECFGMSDFLVLSAEWL
jgi:hypothetical protein